MYGTWAQAEESFDALLDEAGTVEIAGISFDRSRILREIDPTAYRCGLHDFIDAEGIDSDDLEGEPSV